MRSSLPDFFDCMIIHIMFIHFRFIMVMLIVFNYQRPVVSRIPLLEPLGQWYRARVTGKAGSADPIHYP